MSTPQIDKLVVIALGLFMVYAGWATPSFFWNHPHVRRLRDRIGDQGARILHVLLGLAVILLGIAVRGDGAT